MLKFIDQMQREVEAPVFPSRIISLVPSQTELLFDLGLEERIVGITKFCVHPAQDVKQKKKIGGTKNFHLDRIDALQPDLILGNKEENYEAGIHALAQKYPVWMSDITTLEDALQMIAQVGYLTQKVSEASLLIESIASEFELLAQKTALNQQKKRVVYLIWKNPWMCVGSDTFIQDMLVKCGFENVFALESRYPVISLDTLQNLQPDVILLSSEPFPFKEQDAKHLKEICPKAQVRLVNGEMFSWYGSRLRDAPAYFQSVLDTF
jgi:ABC-type Fe3+-hydroxamate transport system substrate-binding protein